MVQRKRKEEIVSAIRKKVPPKTGVYIFRNADGQVIYIGKSINLKQRMLSYFRLKPFDVENRIARMAFDIADFSFEVTRTEFLALLLEDELIKKHGPHYNNRQNELSEFRYLLLTDDNYPALVQVDHSETSKGRRIFGPFKDRYFADDLLNLIQQHLHMRACKDPKPFKRCMNCEIGNCKGPCRQKITPAEYAEIVNKVVAFLNGNETTMVEGLKNAMEAAAEAMDYEKASELKEKIEFCKRFGARQRFIDRFGSEKLVIVENGETEAVYVFEKGEQAGRSNPGEAIASGNLSSVQVARCSGVDPRYLLDRANIVYNWLGKQRDTCEYYFEGGESQRKAPEI
ncbi:MAG: GIY-YIG nuclease family protein [Candidatus Latescibacteria bacterium]|nr:GIY-YIG nuclease family protein [Candidatus Latescibacterota bacterium]NIO29050.1 GIY-YIG nuclease family protein [Candidatus Latescibacterota bacterium]NIO56675.1 GIY-YIG nuclease family protein [Candidatus Latescibacterota bacterium]NIT02258.1 GIY-YIG nuclease family protein [Candidatus Latescibacterota bacterium]NIT39143.1 GIY-YIG nuclease family protein [Candidatus Latescibacterota bacterium]